QIDIFGFEFLLQSLDLLKGTLQFRLCPLTFQFSCCSGGKYFDQIDCARVTIHRLVVKNCDVADDSSLAVEHRNSQVALCSPISQAGIQRKQILKPFLVVASFAVQHFHAWRVNNVELELLSELIAVP